MSSRTKDEGKELSRGPNSVLGRSTPWSEWVWNEQHGCWVSSRLDTLGVEQWEYRFPETSTPLHDPEIPRYTPNPIPPYETGLSSDAHTAACRVKETFQGAQSNPNNGEQEPGSTAESFISANIYQPAYVTALPTGSPDGHDHSPSVSNTHSMAEYNGFVNDHQLSEGLGGLRLNGEDPEPVPQPDPSPGTNVRTCSIIPSHCASYSPLITRDSVTKEDASTDRDEILLVQRQGLHLQFTRSQHRRINPRDANPAPVTAKFTAIRGKESREAEITTLPNIRVKAKSQA
jgi:hypothetical protein